MSPSTLRGRPVITHHQYDAQGRLVRTITGSGWSTEDRLLMIAYRQYLAGLCQCGEPKALARHPDNDGWYEIDVSSTVVCHACTAIDRYRDSSAKPVEYLSLVHTRDYTTRPLPDLAAMAATAGRVA